MALLPPFFLDCVVAIGERGEEGSCSWSASGFLYGKYQAPGSVPDSKTYFTYMVTNRHVLLGRKGAVLRFNPVEDAPAREMDVELIDDDGDLRWAAHPDPDIDVAVLPYDLDALEREGIRFNYFRSDDHALTRDGATDAGLSEGDGVYILGFPMGIVGGDRSFVIARQGGIARVRDWLSGASREFIVDVSVFPGNSGGPVVTRPDATSIVGTQPLRRADLIGVVQSYVPYRDAAISPQTGRTRVIFEENSGLASVVPMDYVHDAIATIDADDRPVPEADAPDVPPEEGSVPTKLVAPVSEATVVPVASRSAGRGSRHRRRRLGASEP